MLLLQYKQWELRREIISFSMTSCIGISWKWKWSFRVVKLDTTASKNYIDDFSPLFGPTPASVTSDNRTVWSLSER